MARMHESSENFGAKPQAQSEAVGRSLSAEAAVLLGGTADGVAKSLDRLKKTSVEGAVEFAGAAVVGAGLAMAESKGGALRLASKLMGGSFAVSFGKELLSNGARASGAVLDTFYHPENAKHNRVTIADVSSKFAYDFTMMAFGAGFGGACGHLSKTRFNLFDKTEVPNFPRPASWTWGDEAARADLVSRSSRVKSPESRASMLGGFDEETIGVANRHTRELRERAQKSVVYFEVTTPGNKLFTGTGFIANPRGEAVTAYHVISNTSTVTARLENGKEYSAIIKKTDPSADLAIVQLEPKNLRMDQNWRPRLNEFVPMKLAHPDEMPHSGESVYALGYNPVFKGLAIAPGKVKGEIRDFEEDQYQGFFSAEQKVIENTAHIWPGFSGGPLIDSNGKVVAVDIAGDDSIKRYFSIPAETVRKLLRSDEVRDPDYWADKLAYRSISRDLPQKTFETLCDLYSQGMTNTFKIAAHIDSKNRRVATGFLVSPDGHLVTTARAVKDADHLRVMYKGTWKYSAKVKHLGDHIAVLKMSPYSMKAIAPAPFSLPECRHDVSEARDIFAFGYEEDVTQLLASHGKLQKDAESFVAPSFGSDYERRSIRFRAHDGFQGSPVVDRDGTLVGMLQTVNDKGWSSTVIPYRTMVRELRNAGVLPS